MSDVADGPDTSVRGSPSRAAPSSADGGNWFTRAFGVSNISFNDDERPSWQGNAWILDARTRAVVWELRRAETTPATLASDHC